ncbi:MAG: cation transporter, partial [Gammaproteobacteria bacterium]
SGQKDDLNIKGAYLHMAADAGVSLGVVVAGAIGLFTGWLLVDPITSLLIVVIIFISTWSLLKDSMNLALDSVPEGINIEAIKNYLSGLPQVSQVHDLHVWAISTTEVALSAHLFIADSDQLPGNFLSRIQQQLHDEHGIEHATIQLEKEGDEQCLLNG